MGFVFFLPCCSISFFFPSVQDKMLRVFDPRAQLTPVQVGPLFRPSQPCQNSLQRGNQTQLLLTHTAFSDSGMRRAIYTCLKPCLRCSFVPPPTRCSDKHVDSKPVRSPPATHSGSSAIDLRLRSASCTLLCALPTGPSSPH